MDDFRRFYELSEIGIFRSTPDGRYITANPAGAHMHGYDSEAELLKAVQDIAADVYVDAEERASMKRQLLEEGAITGVETRIYRHKTREIIWVRQNVYAVLDEKGEVKYLEGHVEDITERKKMHKALLESEAQLQSILDGAPVDISLKDLEGRYLNVNRHFEQSIGLSKDQLLGKTVDSFETNRASRISRMEHEVIATGKVVQDRMDILTINGIKTALVVKFPVYNASGNVVSIGTVAVDVSDLKRAEEALKFSRQEAVDASRAKSEFLSSMSHELRTPLNSVIGFSQMLASNKDEPLSGFQEKCVNHITKSGRHLMGLIGEVLNLSQIETGHVDIKVEDVDLEPVINDCLGIVSVEAVKRDIRIVQSASTVMIVRADVTRLKQVLMNFLSNAIKYNRDGGTITLTIGHEDEKTRISVIDTGVGIPLDRQSELFEPFSRLGAEVTEIEGTGIGLTITQKLATLMGGRVGFESVPGEGSTFWVELPSAVGSPTGSEDTP